MIHVKVNDLSLRFLVAVDALRTQKEFQFGVGSQSARVEVRDGGTGVAAAQQRWASQDTHTKMGSCALDV